MEIEGLILSHLMGRLALFVLSPRRPRDGETSDRRKIVVLRDRPNRRVLDKFLTQLWLYRQRYLREKYFYINRDRDLARQTIRLRWLLEQNIITKTEFKLAQENWVILRSERSPLRPSY